MTDSSQPRNRQYRQAEPPPIAQNDWLDRFARFYLQFGRFARDILGVVLFAFALMSLLAVFESIFNQIRSGSETGYNTVMGGVILSFVASRLRLWLGVGSIFVISCVD